MTEWADLAIGVTEDSPIIYSTNAGAVNVLYGVGLIGLTASGNQIWYAELFGEVGVSADALGSALATGDFDADGYDDLAIGVPGLNADNAGYVDVLYGSQRGLTTRHQRWIQGVSGLGGNPGDSFGRSLAAGDFNGDGSDDLAIGDDLENSFSGSVNVLYGLAGTGLSSAGNQIWDQDSPGIQGENGESGSFGRSLAAGDFDGDGYDDLAIGAPIDDEVALGGGVVNVLYGTSGTGLTSDGNQLWHQDVLWVPGVAEENDQFGRALTSGDFNGDGYDDLAIGVPYESLRTLFGDIYDAGVVHILYGYGRSGLTVVGTQLWYQNSTGILDEAEHVDHFGSSLASGDFNADGYDDLAVGAPGETVGSFGTGIYGGACNVIYGSTSAGLSSAGNQLWNQDAQGVRDWAEDNDGFGFSAAAGDFNGDGYGDLAIGVPYENIDTIGAGAVNVLYGQGPSSAPNEGLELSRASQSEHTLLNGAYPNPFNPATTIIYSIAMVGPVTLTVYNTLGQQVATLIDNPMHPAGEFRVTFNAGELASGIYFYRLQTAGFSGIGKMMLVK